MHCHMANSLRYVSWNCKAVNNPVKRNRVLNHLKSLKADFVFLQETHLRSVDHFRLKRDWVGQVFHSIFHSKSRGCAILVHKSVPFVASDTIVDHKGRYIIVSGTLFSTPLTLANVYAPNYDDPTFISSFLSCIPNMHSHPLILAGDFNCVMSPVLDRSSKKIIALSKCASVIQTFMQKYGIRDAFRHLHPSKREYSFFSHVHQTYSRIDYFFLDQKFIPYLQDCSYQSIVISDHAPIVLELKIPHQLLYLNTVSGVLIQDSYLTRILLNLFLPIYQVLWKSILHQACHTLLFGNA